MSTELEYIYADARRQVEDNLRILERIKSFDRPGDTFATDLRNAIWVGKCTEFVAKYTRWRDTVQARDDGRIARTTPPLKKCLILYGYHDTGKSYLARRLSALLRASYIDMATFGPAYHAAGGSELILEYVNASKERPTVIDELGTEGLADYGRNNVVANMLLALTENFKQYRHPVVITTNLCPYRGPRYTTVDEAPGDSNAQRDRVTSLYGSRFGYRAWKYYMALYTGKTPFDEQATDQCR